jgi:hypothetical protein
MYTARRSSEVGSRPGSTITADDKSDHAWSDLSMYGMTDLRPPGHGTLANAATSLDLVLPVTNFTW